MATIGVNLNIPVGNGTGATSDVSGMAATKTVEVQGSFVAAITLEGIVNGIVCPIATYTGPGTFTVSRLCEGLRVVVSGYVSGSIQVRVSGEAAVLTAIALAVPATDGAGAGVDITSLGELVTMYVGGGMTGALFVEVSEDNAQWSPGFPTATAPGCQTKILPARFARVRRAGVSAIVGGPVTVALIASQASSGGGGGGGGTEGDAITYVDGPAGTQEVWIDSALGDDTNPGSFAEPFQTIAGMRRKVAAEWRNGARVVVNLKGSADGLSTLLYETTDVYLGGNEGYECSYVFRGPAMRPFVPATGPATVVLDAVTPAQRVTQAGVANPAGLRTELLATAAAPAWTVNDFSDNAVFCRITRAGVLIAEVPCSRNSANSVTVDTPNLAAAVAAGDTLELVVPAARITGPDAAQDNTWLVKGTGAGAREIGATRDDPSTFERIALSAPIGVNCNGITFDRCTFTSGTFGTFIGCVSGFVNCNGDAIILINGGDSVGVEPLPREGSATAVVALTLVGANAGLEVRFQGRFASDLPVSIWDGAGLRARGLASQVDMSASTLLGSGNTFGIRAQRNAYIRVQGGDGTVGSNCQITGGGGDLVLETGAAVAYGTASGQFREANGWNGRLCRLGVEEFTDLTGTPGGGAATSRIGIARGTAATPSVATITNGKILANSIILVWHFAGAAAAYQTTGARAVGSFSVSFSSSAAASVDFCWAIMSATGQIGDLSMITV